MKVLVLSVLVAVAAAASIPKDELDLLEAFDHDALFKNEEQRKIAFDCLLEKGPCGDYQKLSEISAKVIESQCADCSPSQKAKYEHVMKTFHDQFEDVYNEYMKKLAAKKA